MREIGEKQNKRMRKEDRTGKKVHLFQQGREGAFVPARDGALGQYGNETI
jgi:hypothetical protein